MRPYILILMFSMITQVQATFLLIPMDEKQKNHLKAYGIAYWILQNNLEVEWLLNYRGGSFLTGYSKTVQIECQLRGVTCEVLADAQVASIKEYISQPDVNMDVMKLVKAPRIAVYAPKYYQPWDDAVMLVLTYAEIPYDVIYDEEVLQGALLKYDWLHLHHEDFTGQFGKFWAAYRNSDWYQKQVEEDQRIARLYGFNKVSKLKLAIAKKIRDFVAGGGYLFAMCSAPESIDIALAAENTDICPEPFDGDPVDYDYAKKLDFTQTFAFQNFTVVVNPYEYAKSNIDVTRTRPKVRQEDDLFVLFEFSAKWDPIATLLTQDHERIIRGFMGQSTAFNPKTLKPNVVVLADNKQFNEARYIYGEFGKGFFAFLGGHDPEDYQHFVYDPPTDLNLFPNSAGYRLILNNVLFPSAQKKQQKT
ncbi:MAG: asparagine synthetase B [Bacteroidales bacterium]|nr:asparagine synthetase B [Bacteroidales bacterium]